jgi:hypothetical protein
MTTRPLESRDLPILEGIYNELNLAFDGGFPADLQHAFVVVDEQDRPFMLTGVRMVPELVMICDRRPHIVVRLKAIALMHEVLRKVFPGGAFCFISPQFGIGFAATMVKRFGWKKTWEGYKVT